MTIETREELIELRVDDIAQLFHTLDPFPFREKDLDREAEEYIVGWARELPGNQPIKIIIHSRTPKLRRRRRQSLTKHSVDISLTGPPLFSATLTSCFGSVAARLQSAWLSLLPVSCPRIL
jgi:hypothetical protein